MLKEGDGKIYSNCNFEGREKEKLVGSCQQCTRLSVLLSMICDYNL